MHLQMQRCEQSYPQIAHLNSVVQKFNVTQVKYLFN